MAIDIYFSFSTKGDRSFGISQKALCLGVQMVDRPFQTKRAIALYNVVKQHFEQTECLTIDNYC
jgi:hypothetical protein